MNKSVSRSLRSVINDLYNDGSVDEITMHEISSLCLPDIKEYSAGRIIELRKKTKLSQAAFAVVVNVSTSTDRNGKEAPRSQQVLASDCLIL